MNCQALLIDFSEICHPWIKCLLLALCFFSLCSHSKCFNSNRGKTKLNKFFANAQREMKLLCRLFYAHVSWKKMPYMSPAFLFYFKEALVQRTRRVLSNSNPFLLNAPHHSLFHKLSKLCFKTYFPAIRTHSFNAFLLMLNLLIFSVIMPQYGLLIPICSYSNSAPGLKHPFLVSAFP